MPHPAMLSANDLQLAAKSLMRALIETDAHRRAGELFHLLQHYDNHAAILNEYDHTGRNVIAAATKARSISLALQLLQLAKYSPDNLCHAAYDGNHLVHDAVKTNNPLLIKRIIDELMTQLPKDKAFFWLAANTSGNTPLHFAAQQKNIPLLMLLLSYIPDTAEKHMQLNRQNIKGDTALHITARHGSLSTSIALLQQGASLTLTNHHNQSPQQLLLAAMTQTDDKHLDQNKLHKLIATHAKLVSYLLTHYRMLNPEIPQALRLFQPDRNGNTPLHHAFLLDKPEIATVLLQYLDVYGMTDAAFTQEESISAPTNQPLLRSISEVINAKK